MAVSKIQDSLSKGSSEFNDNLHCDSCNWTGKQVDATGHCLDCIENLCKQCMEYHTAIKIYIKHKLLCEPKRIIFCKTCERMRIRKMSSGFCLDCRESLCPSCFDYHPRPSATRDHRLVLQQELSETEIVTMLNRVQKEPNPLLVILTAENIDLCVPCLTMSKDVTAYSHCVTCKENLCSDCFRYHPAIAVCLQHSLSLQQKIIQWCKPCARKGKRSSPSGYCGKCTENLCGDCCDYHQRPIAGMIHNLLTPNRMFEYKKQLFKKIST